MKAKAGPATLLQCGIYGGVALWDAFPEAMPEAVRGHAELFERTVARAGGSIVKHFGDSALAAFPSAQAALDAADLLIRHSSDLELPNGIPVRLRAAVHAGGNDPESLEELAALHERAGPGEVVASDTVGPSLGFRSAEPPTELESRLFAPLKASPHNLPTELTRFVGRKGPIEEVLQAFSQGRLVTLTGAGGVGKTRLAQEVGRRLLPDLPDGVWIVDLSAVNDPALIEGAVADALGRKRLGDADPDPLFAHLRGRRVLLILDNCEHLLEAAAAFAVKALRSAEGLRILATSREALNAAGEVRYRVPPMQSPVPTAADEADLEQYEGAELFLDRARLARQDFRVTAEDAPVLAEIIRRLDGIPLALELAAARVASLDLHEIRARLDDRFRLLTTKRRGTLLRHQTLRAAIDWSYELLGDSERKCLQRLALFLGPFRLKAAESVVTGDGIETEGVLDLLGSLVDKSLVFTGQNEDGLVYELTESVRQYGEEKLRESADAEAAIGRFIECMTQIAEREGARASGPDSRQALGRLASEIANLRAAMDLALASDPPNPAVLRAISALGPFWAARGQYSEAYRFTTRVLEMDWGPENAEGRGTALFEAGWQAQHLGLLDEALEWYEQLIVDAEERDDLVQQSWAHLGLGNVAHRGKGDYAGAEEQYLAQVELNRIRCFDRAVASALQNLALSQSRQGKLAEARESYEEAERLLGDGPPTILHVSGCEGLGQVAVMENDLDQAHALFQRGLAWAKELHQMNFAVRILIDIGSLALFRGDPQGAADAFQEARLLLKQAEDFEPLRLSRAGLACAYALLGDRANAMALACQIADSLAPHQEPFVVASELVSLATVGAFGDNPEAGAIAYGTMRAWRDAMTRYVMDVEHAFWARIEDQLRERLGDRAAALIAEGRAIPREDLRTQLRACLLRSR